jgi:thioredoxin
MDNILVEGTDQNFDQEVLKSDVPVLVDFWAPWCGPCRMIAPIVEQIARDYQGKLKVVKLNTDENEQVAIKYGIRSIPTLGIFKNGQVVDAVIGAVPKQFLEQKIRPFVISVN